MSSYQKSTTPNVSYQYYNKCLIYCNTMLHRSHDHFENLEMCEMNARTVLINSRRKKLYLWPPRRLQDTYKNNINEVRS